MTNKAMKRLKEIVEELEELGYPSESSVTLAKAWQILKQEMKENDK